MHKLYTALFVILAFGTYAAIAHTPTATVSAATHAPATPVATVAAPVATPAKPASTPAPATPTPVAPPVATPPETKKKGLYTDGTYTGVAADAFYGSVQVRATISGGRITDITFLSYPSDRQQSQQISRMAMQGLVSQAISLQSANVSGVSGATDTTDAFRQSLSSALAQAA